MEKYKEELKVSCIITAVLCVILTAFSILGFAAEAGLVQLTPATNNTHWQSMWRGMVSGVSIGVLVLMIIGLVRCLQALKDEKKLKKLYVEANDERQIQIWTSARASALQIFVLGGLVAGIIAAYFSMIVGITIIACVFIHSMIGLFCKFYFDIKF